MKVQIQQNIDINRSKSISSSYEHTNNHTIQNGPTILDNCLTKISEYLPPITRYIKKMSTTVQNSTASSQTQPQQQQQQFEEKPVEYKIFYEIVKEEDTEEALRLLKKFFFKDEPLNIYLGMDADCKELEDYAIKSIPEGCSFKAVNENGEMIGVLLNGIIRKPSKDALPHNMADECPHPKFKKILALMDYIDTKFSMFNLYESIDKFMDGKILSVNENYRGAGIAGKLISKTLDYMKENNIPVYHVLCSSHYSGRVCEKLDFVEVYRLPYRDYTINGENPLLPADPHTDVKILIKFTK